MTAADMAVTALSILLWNAALGGLVLTVVACSVRFKALSSPSVRYALFSLVFLRVVLPPTWGIDASGLSAMATGALLAVPTDGLESASRTSSLPAAAMAMAPLWALGCTTVLVRQLRRRRTAIRLAVEAGCDPPPNVESLLRVWAGRLGIRRPLRLVVSRGCTTAFTFGSLRPVVVLPVGMARDRKLVASAIVHELAHVKRWDDLALILRLAIGSAFFFHPGVRYAARQVDLAAEQACDATVLRMLELAPAAYGSQLLSFAGGQPRRVAALPSLVGSLEARVRYLAASSGPNPRFRLATLAAVLFLVALTPVGSVSGGQRFADLVERYSAEASIDPHLVHAVIEVESGGNPDALAPSGAAGLMQLTPKTAELLGVRNPMDVSENLEGGTRYLRKMLDLFDGRVELAVAGYTVGPKRVLAYGGVPPDQRVSEYVARVVSLYERSAGGEGARTLGR